MSVMNIQSGLNSFNQNYLMMNRKKQKQDEESDGNMLNAERLEGYSIDFMNAREHLSTENLNHEIADVESNVSLVQTAASALHHLEDQLSRIWELLRHYSDEQNIEGAKVSVGMMELKGLLEEIDRIASRTRYGEDRLLDGTHTVRAVVNGADLEIVSIGDDIVSSPVRGYPVSIEQSATRSEMIGSVPLNQKLIDHGEQMLVREGNSLLRFTTRNGENLEVTLKRFQQLLRKHDMPIEVKSIEDGKLNLQHINYGSHFRFGAASSTPGVLSSESGKIEPAYPGRDVVGSINGEICHGKGQVLKASEDSIKLSGLRLRYFGSKNSQQPWEAGSVSVFQNAYLFDGGMLKPNIQRLGLQSMKSEHLGREISNVSGFRSLADIGIESSEQVSDSLRLVEKALGEVSDTREKVELFNQDHLKNHLHELKEEHDHLHVDKVLSDDGIRARKMAERTKVQIIHEGGRSTLAQAYQKPQTVLSLLK